MHSPRTKIGRSNSEVIGLASYQRGERTERTDGGETGQEGGRQERAGLRGERRAVRQG